VRSNALSNAAVLFLRPSMRLPQPAPEYSIRPTAEHSSGIIIAIC